MGILQCRQAIVKTYDNIAKLGCGWEFTTNGTEVIGMLN